MRCPTGQHTDRAFECGIFLTADGTQRWRRAAPRDIAPTDPIGTPPHAVYNLGNCRPQKLTDFVSVLEDKIGLKASLELAPMQAGDVTHTFADIEASRRDLGFEPLTPIETGLKHFVGWYRGYHAH